MSRRGDSKAALMDSLAQVRDLIRDDALGDAYVLGLKLGRQLQNLMAYDASEVELLTNETARDEAKAALRTRNHPSEVATS